MVSSQSNYYSFLDALTDVKNEERPRKVMVSSIPGSMTGVSLLKSHIRSSETMREILSRSGSPLSPVWNIPDSCKIHDGIDAKTGFHFH